MASIPEFRSYSTSGSKRAWRSGTNRTRGSIPIGRITCRLRSQRLVRNWWPMIFTVFKAPAEGRTHVFRPNEPFAQIIVVPEEALFDLEEMNEEESAERELQARRIYIAARLWRWVLSGHRRPTRCLTAHIGTCIEPRRKKRAKTSPDDAAFLRSTPRRTQKQDPKGPVFAASRLPPSIIATVGTVMMVVVMVVVMVIMVMVVPESRRHYHDPRPIAVVVMMVVVILCQLHVFIC